MLGLEKRALSLAGLLAGLAAVSSSVAVLSNASDGDADQLVAVLPAEERTPVAGLAPSMDGWQLRTCLGHTQIDMAWGAPARVAVGGKGCQNAAFSASLVRQNAPTPARPLARVSM